MARQITIRAIPGSYTSTFSDEPAAAFTVTVTSEDDNCWYSEADDGRVYAYAKLLWQLAEPLEARPALTVIRGGRVEP